LNVRTNKLVESVSGESFLLRSPRSWRLSFDRRADVGDGYAWVCGGLSLLLFKLGIPFLQHLEMLDGRLDLLV